MSNLNTLISVFIKEAEGSFTDTLTDMLFNTVFPQKSSAKTPREKKWERYQTNLKEQNRVSSPTAAIDLGSKKDIAEMESARKLIKMETGNKNAEIRLGDTLLNKITTLPGAKIRPHNLIFNTYSESNLRNKALNTFKSRPDLQKKYKTSTNYTAHVLNNLPKSIRIQRRMTKDPRVISDKKLEDVTKIRSGFMNTLNKMLSNVGKVRVLPH